MMEGDTEKIISILKSKNFSFSPSISTKSTRYQVLWILQTIKDNTPFKRASSHTISVVLSELMEIDVDEKRARGALAKSLDMVKVHKESDKAYYEIMIKGRQFLSNQSEEDALSERVYAKNSKYDFYQDFKGIVANAKDRLFISDAYLDDASFELYINALPIAIRNKMNIELLINSNNPKGNLCKVANLLKSQNPKLEVRESPDCHDRFLIVDDSAWIFVQSLKAAGNKPTYLVRMKNVSPLESVFESTWSNSKKIV